MRGHRRRGEERGIGREEKGRGGGDKRGLAGGGGGICTILSPTERERAGDDRSWLWRLFRRSCHVADDLFSMAGSLILFQIILGHPL